jgi:REP element-mobilizing transposase RayT
MDQGSYYHIYNRGNNKENIFFEEKNYQHFLRLFDKYLSPYIDVYAYCLMPNHFHFLIRVKTLEEQFSEFETSEVFKTSEVSTPKISEVPQNRGSKKLTPVEKAFKDFFISYAKSINKALGRTGSLFQSKFKKKEITDNAYFTSIIQYIHFNPIKARLCNTYSDYKYSSYNAIIDTGNTKLKRQEVLDWFGNREVFIKVHEERKLEFEKIEKFIFS